MENSELLERFLPGYRIVCRIFAKYLGIDLTKIMTFLFVLFALLKSVQYVWTSISSLLAGWLTSSITVSSDGALHGEVLRWVSSNIIDKDFPKAAGARVLSVASSRDRGAVSRTSSALRYEPAHDSTMWFFRGWRVVFLRRQKAVGSEDTIILTCIGLTTEPLKPFLEECMVSSSGHKSNIAASQNAMSSPSEKKET